MQVELTDLEGSLMLAELCASAHHLWIDAVRLLHAF
jgi:hypothetical protein